MSTTPPTFLRYKPRVSPPAAPLAPLELHVRRIAELRAQSSAIEARANRISVLRLALFLMAAIAASAGIAQGQSLWISAGAVLGLGFFAAVVWHARVLAGRNEVDVRMGVHERHRKRLTGEWNELPSDGRTLLPPEHPYASDIDLVGRGSLFQRIDVSQTHEGERALARALSEPSARDVILARQAAVAELFDKAAFREQLEVLGALRQQRGQKLDHKPFMKLLSMEGVFASRPWLKPLSLLLVGATLTLLVLNQLDLVPSLAVWACVVLQGALLWRLGEPVHRLLNVVTARLGFAQAYEGMLRLIEETTWQAPHLVALQKQLQVESTPPSVHMARLARYEGLAQLRTQGPLYIVLNLLTLWDLICVERIERFKAHVGPHCERWFEVVGELEMLCSLATLKHGDPAASFPEIAEPGAGIQVTGLAHPLLDPKARVTNDLTLRGPGTALIVTGSNMAGKSTLLRALGLNVTLALAGGPVCATKLSLPLVRLRASMRIDDSLQRGASYFHAELTRLRMVVDTLEEGPPVLFLLDELLRGTNAHARHQGARAVLLHLLKRGALGLVATHDVALSELEEELPGRVANVHFTDVFEDGEMRFDYRLRDGVVKTSNALRLLAMAGVDVRVDDTLG